VQDRILLCTVGGSYRPVLRGIEQISPAYVCFFCTGRDPASGRSGSIVQVSGEDSVIKAVSGDPKPTLPNIPTQAGLAGGCFEAREIPADDFDGACFVMRAAAVELGRAIPRSPIHRRLHGQDQDDDRRAGVRGPLKSERVGAPQGLQSPLRANFLSAAAKIARRRD